MKTTVTQKNGKQRTTYHCDGPNCGKKISKKGNLIKTAIAATSNSHPEHHGKHYCRECWKQL